MLFKKIALVILPFLLVSTLLAQSQSATINEEYSVSFETDFVDSGNLNTKSIHDPHPDCPEPKNIRLFESDKGLEISWEGPSASYNGARYIVRYRVRMKASQQYTDWSEVLVSNGNKYIVENLKASATYEIFVKKYCGGSGDSFELESKLVGPRSIVISADRGPGGGGGSSHSCTDLQGANIFSLNATSLTVEWYGPSASPTGVRYFVRYRIAYSMDPWNEIFIANGSSTTIGPLENTTQYEIEIKMVYGGEMMQFDVECNWMNLGVISPFDAGVNETVDPPTDPNLEIELPEFVCGEPFSLPVVNGTNLLINADTSDIFIIGGFPMLVKQVSGGNGNFSGNGLIPLPFGQKIVKVSFTNIGVNDSYEVFSGVINAISDDPGNYPEFVHDTISFGGDICLPPPNQAGFDSTGVYQPTGLLHNELGFDVNGNFILAPPYPGYEPGDPFDPTLDPNGFNSSGIHTITGTPYNENGCSQLGFTAAGQPCDPVGEGPYYWLNQDDNLGPPTEEGIAFANQIADTLEPMIITALQTLAAENQIVIDQYRGASTAIRGDMETLLTTLGHQRIYIFGTNDKYITEGMHEEFATAPEPIALNIPRDPNAVALENSHIQLYHQDDTLGIFLDVNTIIIAEQILGAVGLSVEELLEMVKRFTIEEVEQYSNSANLGDWVYFRMSDKINAIYHTLYGDGIGCLEILPLPRNFNKINTDNIQIKNASFLSPSGALVLNNNNDLGKSLMSEALANALSIEEHENISFEFQQGWKQINGVHRAFYLDHIAKHRAVQTGSESSQLLPIRVSKEVSGREYIMYLDNISFTTIGATLDAYFILEIPTTGDKLVFELLNVSFGPTGAPGDTRLVLGTDIGIRLNNAARLNIIGSEYTYVAWDCEGFAGIGVDAEVEFCRKYLTPLDSVTLEPIPEPAMVSANFKIQLPSWEELIISLDIDPFSITGVDDVKWRVTNAVFDFSDTETPEDIEFPTNYNSPFVNNGEASPLWRGFYLQQLSATLPRQFTDGDSSSTTATVGVENVIIDAMGFTGRAYVAPVLTLEQGNLNGWAFSIDTFGLSVVANNLAGADFQGLINIPILSGDSTATDSIRAVDCLDYTAMILPGNEYHFCVSPQHDYYMNLWKAGAVIDSTSTVSVTYIDNQFKTLATLHGSLSIDSELGAGVNVNIPTISFENVQLSNQSPYFSPGTWGFPSALGVGFAGLDISLSGLGVYSTTEEQEVAMDLNAVFNLTTSDIGITAGGGVRLIGEMIEVGGKQKWQYKEYKVSDVILGGSCPGVSVAGSLSFFEEEPQNLAYGTGFKGIVSANFESIGVDLDAVALFGRKQDYKYFFVDVLANLDPGIDMGGLKLISFGGGVYNNMSRPADGITSLPIANNQGQCVLPPLGESLSGIVYTPDSSYGMGFKATIGIATSKRNIFNANASFEMLFNDPEDEGGGISDIWLYGTGRFMEDFVDNASPVVVENQKPNTNAAVSANVDMHYAFGGDDPGFDATMDVYAYVADGAIRGSGSGDFVGFAELHFSQQDWFINIGTPNQRNGIEIGIDGLATVTIQSYLDIGNNIPTMPEPNIPGGLSALLGLGDFMMNESIRASGNGFAFGANIEMNTGDIDHLIFYANFDAGLGFDLMVQDYNNAYCLQTGDQIGINGWYASGQMWAYVQGDIGVKVKLGGQNKRFKILSIGAAAVLQAKLPNPFWAKGVVGGRYSILGGIVKGNCKFEFTIGESCLIVGGSNPVMDIDLISSLSPSDGNMDIPVFKNPTVLFSLPIGETFELPNLQGGIDAYTVELDYARLVHNGNTLTADLEWDNAHQFLTLVPFAMLPGLDSIDFEVKVSLYDEAGTFIREEIRIARFYTSETLDYIPESNVLASYPLNGQYNFYKTESNQRYILLRQGQPNLFFNVPDGYYQSIELRSADNTGAIVWESPVSYNSLERKITFVMPYPVLQNEKIYRLRIVNKAIPAGSGGMVEVLELENAQTAGGGLNGGGGGGPTGPTGSNTQTSSNTGSSSSSSNNNASDGGSPNGDNNGPAAPSDHDLYTIYFRVSTYNNFSDKVQAFNSMDTTINEENHALNVEAPGLEKFDEFEINGGGKTDPLLSFNANLVYSNWLNDTIVPVAYYFLNNTVDGKTLSYLNRDPELFGDIPTKAVSFYQSPPDEVSPEVQIKIEPINYAINFIQYSLLSPRQTLKYDVFRNIRRDYNDVKNQAAYYMEDFIEDMGASDQQEKLIKLELQATEYEKILGNDYSDPRVPSFNYADHDPPDANYQVKVKYTLPGTNIVTSIATFWLSYHFVVPDGG